MDKSHKCILHGCDNSALNENGAIVKVNNIDLVFTLCAFHEREVTTDFYTIGFILVPKEFKESPNINSQEIHLL